QRVYFLFFSVSGLSRATAILIYDKGAVARLINELPLQTVYKPACMKKYFVLFVCSFLLYLLTGCENHDTLFEPVASSYSGIHFNNKIIENDSINPLDMTNIYNGGGIGVGDFNNDGLPDIYFTG